MFLALLCFLGRSDSSTCKNGVLTITGRQMDIGSSFIKSCPDATSLIVTGSQNEIKKGAFSNSNLVTVSVTGNQVDIKSGAFEGCTKLKAVSATGSQLTVERNAFKDCTALESAHVSGTQAEIKNYAFCGCTNLNSVSCTGTQSEVGDKYDQCGGGSSSGSDSDSGLSARSLGNMEIKSAYLGTSPNIIVNLNFVYSFMRRVRKAFGRAVPSPEIVHSAIWVGEANPTDKSVGALFTYGRYTNKQKSKAFLWEDGAKGYALTFKEFKEKFNAATPMKLKVQKNIKLLDFINQMETNGNWGFKDYNWPTNNCQHFTAKIINVLGATRASPNENDWMDLPKIVFDSLKSNEQK